MSRKNNDRLGDLLESLRTQNKTIAASLCHRWRDQSLDLLRLKVVAEEMNALVVPLPNAIDLSMSASFIRALFDCDADG